MAIKHKGKLYTADPADILQRIEKLAAEALGHANESYKLAQEARKGAHRMEVAAENARAKAEGIQRLVEYMQSEGEA